MIWSTSSIIYAWSFSALLLLFLFLVFLAPIVAYSNDCMGFKEVAGIIRLLLFSSGFNSFNFDDSPSSWPRNSGSLPVPSSYGSSPFSKQFAKFWVAFCSKFRNFSSSLITLWRQFYFSTLALLSKSCVFRSSWWHSRYRFCQFFALPFWWCNSSYSFEMVSCSLLGF